MSKLSAQEFEDLLAASELACFVNWTMLPGMTELLRNTLDHLPPAAAIKHRWAFFDLCDPAKRTPEDLTEALFTIAKFEKSYKVILGLNFNESCQVGEVLGLRFPEQTHASVGHHADSIRRELNIDTVVIHPTRFAGGADSSGVYSLEGPFTVKPKITTGAGDHFNAGFLLGRLLGADLAMSLQIGVATSGFYVREARSPSMQDLAEFLRSLD
jgi:sugar/nucleoside kinase (ribokinase family)